MYKVELNKDNYCTGNLSTVGSFETYIELEELPNDFYDITKARCYYKPDDQDILVLDEEKYSEESIKHDEFLRNLAKETKITEFNQKCNTSIQSGVEYNNSHYSYTTEDQLDLKTAVENAISTGLDVPYHADGESCRLHSVDEIVAIYVACQSNLVHHTTYFNQLKQYINSLTTVEEIQAVEYGQELTGEYLENYNLMIAQSTKLIEAFINRYNTNN